MTAEPIPLIEPASRAELRAWLAENHATSSGVDLAVGKKGNTITALTYDEAVEGVWPSGGSTASRTGWTSIATSSGSHRANAAASGRSRTRSGWLDSARRG